MPSNNDKYITSIQNAQVKEITHLKERRYRDKMGLYLIEGYREISRAKAIRTLYFSKELFLGTNESTLIESLRKSGVEIVQFSQHVFEKISYRDRPDGLIAVAKQKHLGISELMEFLKKTSHPFLLIAEAIEKPGNLGSILRSGDAAGVDAVIVCDKCTDIFNPNVVRSSIGTLFSLPIFETSSSDAIELLKKSKIKIVAATPHAKEEFTKTDLKEKLAIVVGTEQLGLSKPWLNAADIQVKIPMMGIADSLNVANATTLLLYEVLRQRNA